MANTASAEWISAEEARVWWKALMANACALVIDADALVEIESYGRARSLVVLGMEELAKAKWLYAAAEWEWSKPLGSYGDEPQPAGDVCVPDQLATTRLPHDEKLKAAEQFASRLSGFWDGESRGEYYWPEDLETFEGAAKQRNLDKQAGFYVDRDPTGVRPPLDMGDSDVPGLVTHAARVLEMHLIEDHTRQQDAPDSSRIDSAQDLHWAILPVAHREDVADFVKRSRTD
jgi:AbiV family abortive infection protein